MCVCVWVLLDEELLLKSEKETGESERRRGGCERERVCVCMHVFVCVCALTRA